MPDPTSCPYCREGDHFKAMTECDGVVWFRCSQCGHIVMPTEAELKKHLDDTEKSPKQIVAAVLGLREKTLRSGAIFHPRIALVKPPVEIALLAAPPYHKVFR